ncbi:uncharacterized protein JCM6883_002108 [Sporobolomyces salmoneus]|uniref:uncharacterized protein n=1 Tax=Sporobolomyces salmoneus TaxID=183962 RepID=UPI00316FE1A8
MGIASARTLSLGAVCLQSTVLAIVLHVSQAHLEPGHAQYKASSAVLLTELGKLIMSVLLALRDTLKERATLLAPRHPLPTPELYMTSSEEDLLSPDPITPPRSISEASPSARPPRPDTHLRRRSSANVQQTLDVTLDFDEGPLGPPSKKLPEFKTLASFQWPHKPISPRLTEKLRKYAREMDAEKEVQEPLVRKILDDPQMWIRRRRMGVIKMLVEDVFGSDWYKMCVPAILFALQNNLIYIAARNLSVPVFQITFQLKTLITALCAVLMLGRRLAVVQWISLATLGLGVAAMQIGAIHAKANDSHGHGDHPASSAPSMNYVTGVTAVVVSCFSSAIAATYFELVIKRRPSVPPVEEVMLVAPPKLKPVSLWIRNIQLSLFSSVFGLFVVLFQASDVHFRGMGGLSLDFHGLIDPLDHWYDPVLRAGHGFFEGFNTMAWVVVLLQTVGGLLIALALKHADNVAKSLSLSLSIVFTFILSIFLFDFQLTLPSGLGGAAVVLSTILFESSPRSPTNTEPSNRMSYKIKPFLRRWHFIVGVILLTVFGSIAFPTHRYSITTAAKSFFASSQGKLAVHRPGALVKGRPTVAMPNIEHINAVMREAAGPRECAWGVWPKRETTRSAYGALLPASKPTYPYYVTDTDQYALDDILTTRFLAYTNLVPLLSTPSPDFIFLPVLSQIWSNPWGCNSPVLKDGVAQTTRFLRDLVQIVGKTNYPRIILPLSPIRSNLEKEVLTPEVMAEIKDSVIMVSIENAPKNVREGMKYLIDVPYPTAFHLSPSAKGPKPTIGNYFFNNERPYLLHYAGASSHPWGLPASDPFNGFALRAKLHQDFESFVASPGNSTSRIMFDNIAKSLDGAQQLELFHDHMEQAVFCPMPPGDSPTRRAFYEALLLGCIPVLFREHSYGRLFPSSPEINDMSKYTIFIEENDIVNSVGPSVIERLEQVSATRIRKMQEHIRKITPKLQWSLPDKDLYFDPTVTAPSAQSLPPGQPIFDLEKEIAREEKNPPMQDAFETLLKELETIKRGEWKAGRARDNRKGMQKFGNEKRLR